MILLLAACAALEPETLWSAVGNGGVYACVCPGDLDGDGVPDAVAGLYYSDEEPTLQALSGADGSVIWTSDECQGVYQDEGLAVAGDLDGDGIHDVLVCTPGGYDPPGRCLIAVSGASGGVIWQWSCYLYGPNHGWGYGACALDDFTGDGRPEAVGSFGGNSNDHDGTVVCIDGALGDTLWTASGFLDAVEDVCPFPDVDGDGVQEVVAGVGGNSLALQQVWLLSGAAGSPLWSADVDGDVMCLGTSDRDDTFPAILASTFDGKAVCLDQSGNPLWSVSPGGMLLDIEGGPDLDGGGTGEVALAADNAGVRCLDGEDGSTRWTYPSGSNTWSAAWADSIRMGGLYAACIAAGSVNGYRVALVDGADGTELWQQTYGERVYGVSVIPPLGGSQSQTVMACLQDQTSVPLHLAALITPGGLSVPDDPGSGSLSIVSNPCRGTLGFILPDAAWSCGLVDMSGRRVRTAVSPGGMCAVDLDGLPPGVYFFEAVSADVEYSQKVVILGD